MKKAPRTTIQKQKANLKALVDNSNVGFFRSVSRIIKYGIAGFRRNIWLSIAATLVMTVTLVILAITIGAGLILGATAETMKQKIDITIFFAPGTSLEQLDTMANTIRQDPNVREVTVADSSMEFENFLVDNADDEKLLAALEDEEMREIMLSTMQATMRVKVYDPMDLTSIRELVNTDPLFVETQDPEKKPTYDANQAEIATINSWASIAKNGGLILSAIFLVISMLVIFNTIRMAIFSRREEIYMMRLVGASSGFIRGPFIVEAQISGIISGIFASTIIYFGFQAIAPYLSSYGIDVSTVQHIMDGGQLVLVYLVIILAGMTIGTISANLAMQKHLK